MIIIKFCEIQKYSRYSSFFLKKKNDNNNKGIIWKSKYMRREEWNNFTNYKYEEYLTMNKK